MKNKTFNNLVSIGNEVLSYSEDCRAWKTAYPTLYLTSLFLMTAKINDFEEDASWHLEEDGSGILSQTSCSLTLCREVLQW